MILIFKTLLFPGAFILNEIEEDFIKRNLIIIEL